MTQVVTSFLTRKIRQAVLESIPREIFLKHLYRLFKRAQKVALPAARISSGIDPNTHTPTAANPSEIQIHHARKKYSGFILRNQLVAHIFATS
jgi:hypothetical protein